MRKGVLNFFSGRKTIKKKLMAPIELSQENKRRKETLKRKRTKTEAETKELRLLSGKKAPPEEEYRQEFHTLLAERPQFQKKWNQYYPPRTNEGLYSTSLYIPDALGLYQHPQDERNTLNEAGLRIPNTAVPEPVSEHNATEEVAHGYVLGTRETTPLMYESQADVELRTAPFLFGLWYTKKKGEPSPFETIEEIPDDLFDEFRGELQTLDETPNKYNLLFGQSEDELVQFIKDHEIGTEREQVPTKEIGGKQRDFLTKLVNSQVLQPNGSSQLVTKISVPGAIRPARYLASMIEGKKYMIYHTDFNTYRCAIPLDEDMPRIKPLTTLKSNGCITIFNGKRGILKYMRAGIDSQLFYKNWIVLRKEYSPFKSEFERVFASKLLVSSFFVDAMNNWGLVGMDPLFFKLCRAKYPEILYRNSSYLVKDKEFARFYEAVFRPDMRENFLVFDSKFYTQKYELTLENPFVDYEENELHEAFTKAVDQGYVYGMTPYMAYLWKKQNPGLWQRFLFEATDPQTHTGLWQETIVQESFLYAQLNAREKIVIDYLQFLRFLDMLEDDYNFVNARNTYKDLLTDDSIQRELLDLYTEDNPNNRLMMRYLQDVVSPHMSPSEIDVFYMRKREIQAVLQKFRVQLRIRAPRGNAVVNVRPRVSERPVLNLRAPAAPRNELTQLISRIQHLKNERSALLRNPIIFNSSTSTRKNRAAVNKQYTNQLKRMGFFSRFTKGQQRKQLELNRAASRKAFNTLTALNRNIQQLEEELAKRRPLLPASPGSSASTAGSSASTVSLPPFPV
jgi:hypothetical protein